MDSTTEILEPQVTVIPAKPKVNATTGQRKFKRVAAYCRVSTDDDEQLTSYEAQCDYYTKLINSHEGWKPVKVFADEGITGTQAKKRPEFMKMIRYCRQGKIDIILAKSVSRFARNTVESLQYVRELRSLGIAVIFEKEALNTLEQKDEMLITIFSWFAQAESESISKNVAWGVRRSFEQGKFSMHYATTLGYEKGENGNPKIVPEEAETVRLIYSLFLDGMTYRKIAETLSERGFKNAKGNTDWTHSNVASILQNEKYTGDALLQKTFVTDCITKKVKKNNGELPMYLVKDHHEAIIDRTTFNRVQTEIARRTSLRKPSKPDEKGKYSGKYALTGLVICGECGTAYRRITWDDKNGGKVPVWRCINRLKNGKKFCKCSPTVYEDSLHKAVIEAINQVFDVSDDVKNTLRIGIHAVMLPDGKRLAELEKRKMVLNKEIGKLLNQSFKENDYTKYDSEFKRLSDELAVVSQQITAEQERLNECEESAANVQDILDEIESTEFKFDSFDDAIIRHLIELVTIINKNTIRVKICGSESVDVESEK
ncbi:MAG: recombinase family protein [Ruminiclostridium sp.]|nr:recombinase family protein [Ruminiclostridium sp.]